MDAFELSQLQDAIVQSAVDAIIVIDQQGLICFFSPSAEKLFGYDAAQCIGQNVSMLMTRQHGQNYRYWPGCAGTTQRWHGVSDAFVGWRVDNRPGTYFCWRMS